MSHDAASPTAAPTIGLEEFQRIDIRVGTVVSSKPNPAARRPAYVLEIDFGALGMRTSSAQLIDNYDADDLVGRQVIAVVNFAPLRVAGVCSEVLVIGALCPNNGTVLIAPLGPVENGSRIA